MYYNVIIDTLYASRVDKSTTIHNQLRNNVVEDLQCMIAATHSSFHTVHSKLYYIPSWSQYCHFMENRRVKLILQSVLCKSWAPARMRDDRISGARVEITVL